MYLEDIYDLHGKSHYLKIYYNIIPNEKTAHANEELCLLANFFFFNIILTSYTSNGVTKFSYLIFELTVFSLCILSDEYDINISMTIWDIWYTTTPNNVSK